MYTVKNSNLYTLLIILLLMALAISSAAFTASAQPPDKIKVLIAFSHLPGPAEQALVHQAGGDIKYTYDLVPAIAASVPEQAINGLQNNPHVTVIEPDLEVEAIDSELDNTWGVKHIGAGSVHADGNRGAGVKVAVLDTGIDTDHPDLNYDPSCSQSFVAGESLEDGHSHGTHTAGTVAALDNDTGVVGVAPEVTLCIYKVLNNSGGGYYSDIIAAVQQAVVDGVQVTNNSYGSSGDPGLIVKQAFDNAYAAGVLHAGAAGNNGNLEGTGENCIYPARWDSVIATAATMQDDNRASFSSTCPEVELAAPGYQINSTVPGGGYGLMSGTSMASPHLAGTAALVIASGTTGPDQIRLQLQETADDLGVVGRDTWYGFGLVDAYEAVGTTNPINEPPIAAFTTTCSDLSCNFDGSASSDPDGSIVSYIWNFGDGNTGSGVTTSHTFATAGSYFVTLTVTDNNDATDADTQSVTVNEAPTITMHVGNLDGTALNKGNWRAQVTITIHDANHQPVANATVNGTWSGGSSGSSSCTTSANGTCTVTSGNMRKKDTSTIFTVSSVSHASLTYDAADNHDPEGDSSGTAI
jgi:subtilisin